MATLSEQAHRRHPVREWVALTLGILLTWIIYGYQFGTSNHTVYLLSALRQSNPKLLQHDWFTTQTVQYHAAFGWATYLLTQIHALQAGFALGYFLLVVAFHLAWLRLVQLLGGGTKAYIISLLLYYFSAGGTGLGMYQFFQDSSFLPSNVAAVAMLWAIHFRCRRRWIPSAVCFGAAGLFHLNYALVVMGLWIALTIWDRLSERSVRYAVASAVAILPCLANAAVVARIKFSHGAAMPLDAFIDLYVRLRHPHHYELQSWPIALWISFLWPMPIAAIWARRRLRDAAPQALRELTRTSLLLGGLVVAAILGAGIWYVNESLVQMSLYRFTIYLQLFTCIAVAMAATEMRAGDFLFSLACAAGVIVPIVAICFIRRPLVIERQGALIALAGACGFVFLLPRIHSRIAAGLAVGLLGLVIALPQASGVIRWSQTDDSEYLTLCDWARDNTPVDAVFIVPPNETEWRLGAQRAIVVNYKCVPQLSSELPQWRDRLQDVLDLPDLMVLPRGFWATSQAIAQRYSLVPGAQLNRVADRYGARYLVAVRRLGDLPDSAIVYTSARGKYLVYDLARGKQKETAVDREHIERALLEHFGIRIQPEMSQYILRQLESRSHPVIPVIGSLARTGIPVRLLIPVDSLHTPSATGFSGA